MLCLIQVSYIGCDRTKAVVLMTIAVTCIGGMYSGFLANHIDIAPNFAGSLVAITNFVATIPGFVVPVFVGQLTHGNVSNMAKRILKFQGGKKTRPNYFQRNKKSLNHFFYFVDYVEYIGVLCFFIIYSKL